MAFWNFKKSEENDEEVELRIDGDIVMEDDFWSIIFGIENVTPKGFMSELEKYKGKDINVWINSYGGDVYAASRIYTALKEHSGKVRVKVDGVAISAASVIAMAGDEVLMSPTSILMIHNPWGSFRGEAKDLRHAAEVLDEVKETIVNAYQMKTGKSRNKISKLMDEETWMSSRKAVNQGFADGVLYMNNGEGESEGVIENSFMFNRHAVLRNGSQMIEAFIQQYNERMKEINKDDENLNIMKLKLALECEL